MLGYDYTERIDPAALVATGCAAVFRYTTRPSWPKSITRAEVAELGRIRMPLACNFESTANRMRGAAPAGHADAVEQSGNLAMLGIPPQAVRSWFSADWDVQPGEVSAVLDYLHAAADVLGGKRFVGCYGGLRAVSAAMDAGFAGWQTVAWSGGRWDPRAVARQTGQQVTVAGVRVDVNQIIDLAGLGTWGGLTFGGSMGTIPATIGQKWPEIAADFPANGQFDNDTALIYGDAGARAAALYAKQARDAVNALAAKLQQPQVDVKALAAALAPLLQAGATADQMATAVVSHLATTLAKG